MGIKKKLQPGVWLNIRSCYAAASSRKRNVTVWRSNFSPSVCPVGIHTVTH